MRLAQFLKVAKMLSYRLACALVVSRFPQFTIAQLPKLQFHPTMIVNLAYCSYKNHKIIVSRKHYNKNKSIFANEVFLHELAHYVAGELYECYDHGAAWQSVCAVLGIPDRLTIEVDF